ncbi:hypothetical protein K8R14_01240 [bacterium]|nr:hypothetical protein [bacterium]
MKFQSIVFEGGDQVGKNDATYELSTKLMSENIPVLQLCFPSYASPIGSVIRLFLKHGVDDIESFNQIVGTKREIEIRMMMYVLDRLQALESILRGSKKKEGVLLFDRSPYSNALTIAYGLGGVKSITKKDIRELVKLGFEADQLMIQKLNLTNCVIHLQSSHGDGGWKPSRSDDADKYEVREIQEMADFVYNQFAKLVGDGWEKVLTKENGIWRKREDINSDIRELVDSRMELVGSKNAKFEIFDIIDIARDMYGVDIAEMEEVKRYYKAMGESDKETIYKEGIEISKYITLHSKKVTFEDKEVLREFRSLLKRYPECLDLMEYYLNKDFVDKFKVAVFG